MTNTGPCVVAYETDPNHPGLHRLLRSLERWKWQHNIILDRRWRGFGHRLKRVVEACRDLVGRYTHVIHVDARDVIAVGPPSEWVPPPVPLLLATEMNVWPNPTLKPLYPDHPSPWKFAHSQFTVDQKRLDVFNGVDSIPDHYDDQLWVSELFLKGTPDVALDYAGATVQSIAFSHPWADYFEVDDDRVVNKITGTRPLLCHGNGGTDMSWLPGGKL